MAIGATKLNIKNLRKRNNNLLTLLVLILGILYSLIGVLEISNIYTLLPYLTVVTFMGLVISKPIAYGIIGILLECISFSIYLIILGCSFVVISFLWRKSFNEI